MAHLKSEIEATRTMRRTSSRLKSKKDVLELPETQQSGDTEEDTQQSADAGLEGDQEENGTRKTSITDGGVGFTSALKIHNLGRLKEQKEPQRHATRSTGGVKNNATNSATTTKLAEEVLAWDSQKDKEVGEAVGWDMESISGDEDDSRDYLRTPRIENLLPKHRLWDRNIQNGPEDDLELAPPSSHPRESSVVDFKSQHSSEEEDMGYFQNTEGQLISPDRGNQRWDASLLEPLSGSSDHVHHNTIVSKSESNVQFSQPLQPLIQSQSMITNSPTSPSQSRPRQKHKKPKTQSL